MSVALEEKREIDKINAEIVSASQSQMLSCQEKNILEKAPRANFGLQTVKDSIASTPLNDSFNPGFYLIGLQNETEAINKLDISLSKTEIEDDLEQLKKLNDEKIAALKEHAIKVNSAATWEAIKNVATYFSFATSTIVGYSACINPTLSVLLIGSGIAGIANRVLTDTGVWKSIASYFVKEEEAQEKVVRYVDMGFSALTTGIGLFNVIGGSIFGVETLLANGSWDILKQAGYFGSTLMSAVSTYKSSDSKSKVCKNESILTEIEGRHIDLTNSLKSKMTDLEQTVRHNSKIAEQVHSTIKSTIESSRNLTNR